MTDQPTAGVALEPLDFNGLSDTFERNPRWIETDQEMVWTAINHIRGDYEDADEDAPEQVMERLLHIIRRQNIALSTPASGAVEAQRRFLFAPHGQRTARLTALQEAVQTALKAEMRVARLQSGEA